MIRAGVTIAIAFLVCQKAVWYILASDAALLLCFIFQDRSKNMARHILHFNLSALTILLAYILFWSALSDYPTVLDSLFYEPWFLSNIDWYQPQIGKYHAFLVINNLGIIALCLIALTGLAALPADNRLFTLTYVLVILFFTLRIKQPFAYTPMATFPALLILFSSFFTSLEMHPVKTAWRSYLGFFLMFSVLIWSAFRMMTVLPGLNGSYQRSMLPVITALLDKGDSYIAGVPLLPTVNQSVPGLEHLVGPAVDYMYQPDDRLHAILSLRSLYFTPATVPQLIESIKNTPIKFYVDNNRLHYTPPALHQFLDSQYQHFWSSIYLYAPRVDAGQQAVKVKFAGSYRVQSKEEIRLDGRLIKPETLIQLKPGTYQSDASAPYRLALQQEQVSGLLHEEFREDRWWLTLSPW